jgi:choline-sulfatase
MQHSDDKKGHAMPDAPNILVLISDQHNPHVLGCTGDPLVRTPNLDRLASEGTLFEHCYCPSPLCVPSRMSFMTSRYPSHNEVWTNRCTLRSDIPTFAHGLGVAGYETILSGRMHFVGPDQRHGFERRIMGSLSPTYVGSPFNALPRELLNATGQSREAVEVSGPGRTGYQYYDEMVAEATVSFLKEAGEQQRERSFCLTAGFVLPHCPFICPRDDFEYYLDRVPLPEVPDGYYEGLHPAVKAWRKNRRVEDLTEDEIRRARAGYYGIVTHFDRQVGKVLDALEESGLADNTVVIYTSDHGEMAGENGMWWKSNFYEGAASVPLIVSWPGRIPEGQRLNQVVNLVDIGPTLLELAGSPPLPQVDGRSFAPLLLGGEADWRDETFSEHHADQGVPATRMIRRGPWKLVHYDGHRPQLFNLDDDPNEFHDLGEDPRYADLMRDLTECVLADWSALRIGETLERRESAIRLITEWVDAVHPATPEQWIAPPGVNVFPDHGE